MIMLPLLIGCALLSYVLTGAIRQYALRRGILDVPNARSSHSKPTPRGGGLAIAVVVPIATAAGIAMDVIPLRVGVGIAGGAVLVAGIGWIDDHRPISAGVRATVHTLAATWAVGWLGGLVSLRLPGAEIALGWAGGALAVLYIVWSTNLYNFMDGVDGLAGGEAVLVGTVGGGLLWLDGAAGLSIIAWIIAAAATGFVLWNWPPAKIFMGDVGSGLIGFLFGALAVASESLGRMPLWEWVLLLGVFYFDATITLVRRAARGERLFEAHRSHAYQRAVQAGWTHGEVTIVSLLLTTLLCTGLVAGRLWPDHQWFFLLAGVVLLAGAYASVEALEPMGDGQPADRPRNELRVLYVVNAAWFFAAQRMGPAIELASRGVDVHVIAAPDGAVDQIGNADITFHPLNISRRGLNPLLEAGTLIRLARMYRRIKPDLVHHITIKPVVYGGIASRVAGVPAAVHSISGMGFVFLAPGQRGALLRLIVRAAYRFVSRHPNSRVIFENQDDLETFVRNKLVPPDRARLIRGVGVDLRRFRPVEHTGDSTVVVLPARLLWDKGVAEFLEAARLLRDRRVPVRMVLVGRPDPGNPASVSELDLREWTDEGIVESWGWHSDMPAVYRKADVVCLPSYREGLPTALVEAAACGLPVVATDAPGCREIVRDGHTGILVPVRSAEALALAIERLVASPELRQRLGRQARAHARAEYAVDKIVHQTLQTYDELIPARLDGVISGEGGQLE